MDLSIIITAHDEGLIAHKTILSVFRALKEVPDIKYEIIVHIDNGDEATIDYFKRYKNDKRFKIIQNKFGDSGLSRNCAIRSASGKYIQVIDADDIICSSHFKLAFAAVKENENFLYHPEYVYFFGDVYTLKIQSDAIDKDQAAQALLSENDWCSTMFGKRELIANTPYRATVDGFGHEDWMFNIETTEKGVLHKVLKGSILFYRKAGSSLVDANTNNHSIQQYSKLFDFDVFKDYEVKSEDAHPKPITKKEKAVYYYKKIRSNKKINYFITPMAEVAKKITGKGITEDGPYPCDRYFQGEFLEQVLDAHKIDNAIIPYKEEAREMEVLIPAKSIRVTQRYIEVAKLIGSKKISYLFFVPWLTAGGADKAAINYVKSICELVKDEYVVVFGMEPSKNEWAKELPKNAIFIDYGELAKDLYEQEREILLSRIILQTRCNRIHIINSRDAYSWVKSHIDFAKAHLTVSASFFARSNSPAYKGLIRTDDFADPYLMRIHNVLKFIATDNKSIHSYLINDCGIDPRKVLVHYQPSVIDANTDAKKKDDGKIHILWASRVCKEKNPELLIRIAKKLPADKYQIDMYGKIWGNYTEKDFKNIDSLSYQGVYNGIDSINPSSYDIFLYTSLSDGLPNVVLEIPHYSVPMVASDAGGVGDFVINEKTGLLIEDITNEDKYIEAIERLGEDEVLRKKLAANAKDLIEKRHSWKAFLDTVKKDFLN